MATKQVLTSHMPVEKRRQGFSSGKSWNGNALPTSRGKNREAGYSRPEKSRHAPNADKKPFQKRDPRRPAPAAKPVHETRDKDNRGADQKFPSQTPALSNKGKRVGNIEPFELFCAYHLGIEANDTYKASNINQVASRFKVEPATVRQATKEYGFDPEAMLDKDFDVALAQLDIQVAPEGISKIELAKTIYEDFLNAPVLKRDWKKLLEEDRKENIKVFGS